MAEAVFQCVGLTTQVDENLMDAVTALSASGPAFLYVVIECIRSGRKSAERPWEGADSLEWTHLPCPAPYHTFETVPDVK